MRADRLLSLLMLLQARGRMTARDLAKELEVTERTIYRDVDALSFSGVPIYGDPGPNGGYALLDSYRTNLTGLSDGEVRALFMLSIPAPLDDLGVSRELKAAMLKLSAALPDARRGDEERVRQRFYLDSSGWHLGEELVPHLQAVHQAVWQDRKLAISYRLPPLAAEVERLVEPYGLVAKAGVWYLVFVHKERLRTRRVSELLDACLSEEPFARPADFDLATYWKAWCARLEESHSFYPVTVRVAPNFVPELPRFFGGRIREKVAQAGPPDAEGWIRLELAFESLEAARERIVSFGRGLEVIEPRALRLSVVDLARQVVKLYEG